MSRQLAALLHDENGASLVEYSVLVGLIAAAVAALLTFVSYSIRDTWVYLWEELFAVCFGGCPTDV